ncbi:hypothetical protein L798_14165 [Zootermopsis nevadensis]|uniref:Uncharacterized protein n=1 Tax=Zootermopsis nevadensis TaxID=136037 RepID=A0A067RIR0_ZOONE|nr:hypothetical protein L798_14165 [Zootermopsis nevadensis]
MHEGGFAIIHTLALAIQFKETAGCCSNKMGLRTDAGNVQTNIFLAQYCTQLYIQVNRNFGTSHQPTNPRDKITFLSFSPFSPAVLDLHMHHVLANNATINHVHIHTTLCMYS